MESIKILQFVPYFPPYPGGQERYVFNLSKYLVKRGHEVYVITSNYPKSKRLEKIDGITIERYPVLVRPLRNPIAPQFFSVFRKFKEFDLVHIHNEYSLPSMIAAYARTVQRFPLVLTNHIKLIFGDFLADIIADKYIKTTGSKIHKVVDAIVTVSNPDKEFLSSISPHSREKIRVIPNGIDPEFLLEESEKADFLNLSELEQGFKILYVGVLVKRKGLNWLIEAIRLLKDQGIDNIRAIFVGEGPDREFFGSLVRKYKLDNVIMFTGRISNTELAWLYKNSDVFVLPSLAEGCSTAILEAMFFGLPVITTDIPQNRDHFEDYAILVPPKNEKAIADAITTLVENRGLARKLSQAGKKLVLNKYTWDKITDKYENLYRNVLNSHEQYKQRGDY